MERAIRAELIREGWRGGSGPRADRIEIPVNLGENLRFRIVTTEGRITLAGVMDVARALADELCLAAAKDVRSKGRTISCGKGCGACCRYLVGLSAPEAFRLVDEIEAVDTTERGRVEMAFQSAAECVLQACPPPDPDSQRCNTPKPGDDLRISNDSDGLGAGADGTDSAAEAIGQWYSQLKLACPFLHDEVCSFYPNRPISCREHLVTSDARYCVGFQPGAGSKVRLPVSIAEALTRLAAEMENLPIEAVIMPLAPAWVAINASRRRRTWPAREMFERFASILHRMARHNKRHAAA